MAAGERRTGTPGNGGKVVPHPNLYVLGPPRTGTTSLARWLTETPNIYVSRPKEPAYHALDLPMSDRIGDRDEYLALFAEAGKTAYRCDATPWYLYATKAAASIHDMAPDARLVVNLRNPVDMLASLHNHHRFVGIESEPDFGRAVFTPRLPNATDFRANLDYLAVGRLGEQVARFVDLFPREQIRFQRFEETTADPKRAHLALVEWLGLEPRPLRTYEALNTARRSVIEALRPATEWMTREERPRPIRMIGSRLHKVNTATKKNEVEPAVRQRILDQLEPDIALLAQLCGRDVTSWWL